MTNAGPLDNEAGTGTLSDLMNPTLSGPLPPSQQFDWSQLASQRIPVPPRPADGSRSDAALDAMLTAAIAKHVSGKAREAMETYREVILYDRGNKKALYFAAIALSQENAADQAYVVALMEHAVKELKAVPEAHYNLGILYHRLGRIDDAKRCFETAIAIYPKLIEAKTSLAGTLLNLGDVAGAKALLENAVRTTSKSFDSIYARGFAHLMLGDFDRGWTDYRARWKTSSFVAEHQRSFAGVTHWHGHPIPGKNLYIHTEQGAGDIIMFSRYLARVAERSKAKWIILEVGANVLPHVLQCQGVDYFIATNTAVPDDPDCPGQSIRVHHYLPYMTMVEMMGAPWPTRRITEGTWLTPREKALLAKDHGWPVAWPAQMPGSAGWMTAQSDYSVTVPPAPPERLKVGLCWAGSSAHKNDRYRTIGWPLFRDELVRDPRFADRVQWYSLQVGEHAREMDEGGAELGVIDLTPQCTTFAETASAVAQMDLLIAVDTATVHVAGSLIDGPPVLMLTPAAPDWRWFLDGETTPWYDRVQLLRQTTYDDWRTPLRRAADLLAERLPRDLPS